MFRNHSLNPVLSSLLGALVIAALAAPAVASPLGGDPLAAPTCEETNPENPEVCQEGGGIDPIEIEPDKAVWTPKAPSGTAASRGGDLAGRLASWLEALQGRGDELASRLRSLASASGAGGR